MERGAGFREDALDEEGAGMAEYEARSGGVLVCESGG